MTNIEHCNAGPNYCPQCLKEGLPPLPEPDINTASHIHTRIVGYTAGRVREYAAQAVQAERESRAAKWEQYHGFDKYGVAEFIRARGEKT